MYARALALFPHRRRLVLLVAPLAELDAHLADAVEVPVDALLLSRGEGPAGRREASCPGELAKDLEVVRTGYSLPEERAAAVTLLGQLVRADDG